MLQYNMNAPMRAILEKSQLRNALMKEWPSLESIDINTIATETELVNAIARCTGRTTPEATVVVRNWMERHSLPPVDRKADRLHDRGKETWENEGGSNPSTSL